MITGSEHQTNGELATNKSNIMEYTKEEFKKFLEKHEAFDSFCKCLADPNLGGRREEGTTFDQAWEMLDEFDKERPIDCLLWWSKTPEKNGYWGRLNDLWQQRDRFTRFLQDRGAYGRFCANLGKRTFDEWLNSEQGPWWIINAFDWERSEEGYSFWYDISQMWRPHI